jgi:hypothetical protein
MAEDLPVLVPATLVPADIPPPVVDSGLLDSELLDSELLDSGLLDSGLLESGLLESELFESGPLESGLLNHRSLNRDTLKRDPAQPPFVGPRFVEPPVLDRAVLERPVVEPPVVRLCAPASGANPSDKGGFQETALNSRTVVNGVPSGSNDALSPFPLTPRQCQCQAAANSTIANLLDRERAEPDRRQGLCSRLKNHGSVQATTLKREILADTACEVRNQTASAALEAYFRLAETEARSELAAKAAVVLVDAVARGRKLKAQGIKTPPELDTLERKEIDLKSDTAKLRLAQARLQHDLKALLSPPANAPEYLIRPVLDMDAYVAPVDSEAEVAKGLATRPELRMWRALVEGLDAASLPVAQAALQAVNPLAGGALDKGARSGCAGLKAVLELCKRQTDAETLREKMLAYESEREQQIASDIRRDVQLLAIQTEILILARHRAADSHRHLEELADRQSKGLGSFADTAEARLEFLRDRGTVVEAAASLIIYKVKLRQDQGLLAAECCPGCEPAYPSDAGKTPCTTAP